MKERWRNFSLNRAILSSFSVHLAFFGLLWTLVFTNVFRLPVQELNIDLSLLAPKVQPRGPKPPNPPIAQKKPRTIRGHARLFAKLDLRPEFMKRPISGGKKEAPLFANENSVAKLLTELPRTSLAFDHLAASIGRNLDYPDLLFDHGVQGTASLDLWFDDQGKIDEERSRFRGSHIAIRGMLAHASRLALVEWYRSDAYRLKKSEFAEQHFIADFILSYTENNQSHVLKDDQSSYRIQKIRKKLECLQAGGVDLVCLAMKTAGAIDQSVSDSSRIRYELLLERLNAYDDQALAGINASLPQS